MTARIAKSAKIAKIAKIEKLNCISHASPKAGERVGHPKRVIAKIAKT